MTFMAAHKPAKIAQFGHRVFGIPVTGDNRTDALSAVDALKAFFLSIGLPITMTQLGIENPDIPLLVKKFHEDKGLPFGPYHPLYPTDTEAVYHLML